MSMLSRRRFISIAAVGAAASLVGLSGGSARTVEWKGYAFGAQVSIKLDDNDRDAQSALEQVVGEIRALEKLFSIYDPASALSQLNRDGQLAMPPDFSRLVQLADDAWKTTGGLFDPTVQSIFAAKLKGHDPAQAITGWEHVRFTRDRITLPKAGSTALTFNGIAQGYATDRVRELLAGHGYTKTLINIGEFAAGDRKAKIGIANTGGELLDVAEIKNQAIATSSPGGYRFADGTGHILRADNKAYEPIWDTVSVIAKSAAMADAYSTALVLAPNENLARELKRKRQVEHAYLIGSDRSVLHL